MAGPNTTGLPNTEDYNLGRGKLYFSELDANGLPTSWRDMGNAPEFNLSIESETLEHQSSREGLKIVDKEVVLSQSLTCTFSLDELNDENLALIFSGAKATHTNVAVAGFAEFKMVDNVELGVWYDIVNSSGARAYDIATANLTVEKSGAPDTTLVEGTDYTVDEHMGRIFLLSTAVNIAAGDDLDVTLAADAGALAVNEVRSLTQTNVIGALKFISENPADNDRQSEYTFHKISLKSNGDFSLIGDDWTKMPFTAKAEANTNALFANSPTMTKRTVAAA